MTTLFTCVLVVDPDSHALRALRINLSAHDYRVLTATDATDALQTATNWRGCTASGSSLRRRWLK